LFQYGELPEGAMEEVIQFNLISQLSGLVKIFALAKS